MHAQPTAVAAAVLCLSLFLLYPKRPLDVLLYYYYYIIIVVVAVVVVVKTVVSCDALYRQC